MGSVRYLKVCLLISGWDTQHFPKFRDLQDDNLMITETVDL